MGLLEPPLDAMPPEALLGLCLSQTRGEIVGIAVISRSLLVFLQEGLPSMACLKSGEMVLELGEIAAVARLILSVPEVCAGYKPCAAPAGLDGRRVLAHRRRTRRLRVRFWRRVQRVGEG